MMITTSNERLASSPPHVVVVFVVIRLLLCLKLRLVAEDDLKRRDGHQRSEEGTDSRPVICDESWPRNLELNRIDETRLLLESIE